MKTIRTYCTSHSCLVLALFMSILPACTGKFTKTPSSAPTGVVAGNVTVDAISTNLRYVYAREHAARAVDLERLGLRNGETIDDGVISVVLSHEPLSAELVDDLVGDMTRIPSNIVGIFLTIDPSRHYHWESQFLGNSERTTLFGYTTTAGEAPIAEAGRIRARLALTNQDAIHRRAFLVAFDSLLPQDNAAWSPGALTPYDRANCGSALQFEAYRKAMPGRWATESEHAESAVLTGGRLTIHEEVGEQQFLGTFHFVVNDGDLEVDEEVVVDCVDSRIQMRGAVVPGTPWSADTMVFVLQGKRLVGTGKDEAGRSMQVVLKKIR